MKCRKGSLRKHLSIVGPSVVVKVVGAENSFAPFAEWHDTNWQWEESLTRFCTDGLFREDPLEVRDFLVPYSMNKKKRWILPEFLEENIEQIQDSYLNVRVSASIHTCSRNNRMPRLLQRPWGWERQESHVESMPVEAYFDVLSDGEVVRAKHTNAHLDTLDLNTSHAKRPRTDSEFRARFNLPFDESAVFQPVHVRYNILRLVRDKRPVHTYNDFHHARHRNRKERKEKSRREPSPDDSFCYDDEDDTVNEDHDLTISVEHNLHSHLTLADFLTSQFLVELKATKCK